MLAIPEDRDFVPITWKGTLNWFTMSRVKLFLKPHENQICHMSYPRVKFSLYFFIYAIFQTSSWSWLERETIYNQKLDEDCQHKERLSQQKVSINRQNETIHFIIYNFFREFLCVLANRSVTYKNHVNHLQLLSCLSKYKIESFERISSV